MDHAYLPIRCPEINEDRIFVKRKIVFLSEGLADCLRSQQDSRVGRYRTFVSGMLPHDLLAAFIDVVERKDLSPDDAQQTQGKFVFAGQISTLVAVWSFFQLFLQPFGFFFECCHIYSLFCVMILLSARGSKIPRPLPSFILRQKIPDVFPGRVNVAFDGKSERQTKRCQLGEH